MKKILAVVLGTVGMGMGSGTALAHHSFSAEFDINKPIVLTGTLVEMKWTNPHGWLYVDVKGDDGSTVRWAVETGSPNALLRKGLRKTDLPSGSEIVVEGFLSKSGKPVMNAVTVKLSGGRTFFMGSSGAGAPSASKPK